MLTGKHGMENWTPFWLFTYFGSVIMAAVFLALEGLAYAEGNLRGLTEGEWTIRIFGALVGGILVGLLLGFSTLIKDKEGDKDAEGS
jgi:hypothetical protein